jgi:ubiquinone/menaquinone biosynthesis C-methylase UbiE
LISGGKGEEADLLSFVTNTFGRLSQSAYNFQTIVTHHVEEVHPGDVEKPDFAEKLSASIALRMPFYSGEALPGEQWESDISQRRTRAFEAIQNKINPKHRYTFPNLREILPRDVELRKALDSQNTLLSYGLKSGDIFVDVSCFEGLFTIPAATIVGEKGRVYGIEFSSLALEKLKVHVSQNNLNNVTLCNGFPEKARLNEKMADIVFFGTAMYEMYNPMKALRNAYDMLKDSGKLIILEWRSRDFDKRLASHSVEDLGVGPTMSGRVSKWLIVGFVEKSGFKVETIREEGSYLYSIIAKKSRSQKKNGPVDRISEAGREALRRKDK